MAVHDTGFSVYGGRRTPRWTRFAVLARYALEDVLGWKRTIVGLVAAAVYPLVAAVIVYLHHNAEALAILQIPVDEIIAIDAGFFLRLVKIQSVFAFFLVLTAGSTLVSRDMRDNALPLYLGRPLSRFEYVAGKSVVPALLGSLATWVPGLLLFGFQVSLTGGEWLAENALVPVGIFFGSWVVVLLLSLVCLAVSSLIRNRAAAEGTFVSLFIVLPLVGAIVDQQLGTRWGTHLNLPVVLDALWRPLFGAVPSEALAPGRAWIVVLVMAGLAVAVLARRVKAYRVVR